MSKNDITKYSDKEIFSVTIGTLLEKNLFSLDSLEFVKEKIENNKKFNYDNLFINKINNKIDELKGLDIER